MSVGFYQAAIATGTAVGFSVLSAQDFSPPKVSENKAARDEFNEHFLFCAYYTLTTLWSVYIYFGGLYSFDADTITTPNIITDATERPFIELYSVQLGFYFYTFYKFLFADKEVVDRRRMIFHHFLTLTLLVVSLVAGYWRIGFLVLMLHDATDVFLYGAKALRVCVKATGQFESRTLAMFVLFVVSFVVLRLVLFPWLVISPASKASVINCDLAHTFTVLSPVRFTYKDIWTMISERHPGKQSIVYALGSVTYIVVLCVWEVGMIIANLVIGLQELMLAGATAVLPGFRYESTSVPFFTVACRGPLRLLEYVRMLFWDVPLSAAGVTETNCISREYCLLMLLIVLFLLQITWFVDIVAHIAAMGKKGVVAKDVREAPSDEGDDNPASEDTGKDE